MERISKIIKHGALKRLTQKNTFADQATPNQFADDIRKDMAHIRKELGLVLKNVSGGPKKVNLVN